MVVCLAPILMENETSFRITCTNIKSQYVTSGHFNYTSGVLYSVIKFLVTLIPFWMFAVHNSPFDVLL